MRRMVPMRRSVNTSSRYSAAGSSLISFCSDLVAMSTYGRSLHRLLRQHALPAAGAFFHIRVVRTRVRAVEPVLRLRRRSRRIGLDIDRRRRIVIRRRGRIVIRRGEEHGGPDQDRRAIEMRAMDNSGARRAAEVMAAMGAAPA